MAKLALCIKRADAPQAVIDAFNGTAGTLIPIPESFWSTRTELVDRAICETDETWLQLLPYIAVNANQKVFMYTRGGGGEEARLHGNYSLGVGGHVDVAPDEDFADINELVNVIRTEAAREIEEEIKITVLPSTLNPTYFICDPTNSVGRVHLGLLINHELNATQAIDFVNGLEEGIIENARMVGASDLHSEAVYPRLENWSMIVADAFYKEVLDSDVAADESQNLTDLNAFLHGQVWNGGYNIKSVSSEVNDTLPDGTPTQMTFVVTSNAFVEVPGADPDWDAPNREVGGDLIEGAKEDLLENECEDCYECDKSVEDCTCDSDECELCGNDSEDCACIENDSIGCAGCQLDACECPETSGAAETRTVVTGGTNPEDNF